VIVVADDHAEPIAVEGAGQPVFRDEPAHEFGVAMQVLVHAKVQG